MSFDPLPSPLPSPPSPIPSPTYEPVLPSPGTVLKAAPVDQGEMQLWLTSKFGPSYATTLSGMVAALGAFMLPFAPLFTGKAQAVYTSLCAALTGGGAAATGYYSKSKNVSGREDMTSGKPS